MLPSSPLPYFGGFVIYVQNYLIFWETPPRMYILIMIFSFVLVVTFLNITILSRRQLYIVGFLIKHISVYVFRGWFF